VQKIIDFQWVTTLKFMRAQFMMYFWLYLIPIYVLVFTNDERIHYWSLNVATVPAFLLFGIEIVQMGEGVDYFIGWNIADFMLFVSFSCLRIVKFSGIEDDAIYIPEL